MTKYLVRQYRPAFVTGLTNQVLRGVEPDKITEVPWLEGFKLTDFDKFTVTPYNGDELIIEAHYRDGKHLVAGFALPEDSEMMSNNNDLMRDNWRYKEHES